jgi:hypothetical protein
MIFGSCFLYLHPIWINFGPDDVDKKFLQWFGFRENSAQYRQSYPSLPTSIVQFWVKLFRQTQSASNAVERFMTVVKIGEAQSTQFLAGSNKMTFTRAPRSVWYSKSTQHSAKVLQYVTVYNICSLLTTCFRWMERYCQEKKMLACV